LFAPKIAKQSKGTLDENRRIEGLTPSPDLNVQLWKLGIFFACPLVALFLVIGAFMAFPNHEPLGIVMLLAGILLGAICLGWANLAIDCPQCKARLFWFEESTAGKLDELASFP